MTSRTILLSAAILLPALLLSCGSDTSTNPGNEADYSRGTPEEVVEAFALAIETRNIAIYEECLSQDYRFEFIPEDADSVGLPPDRPWWQAAQDLAAMFAVVDGIVRPSTEKRYPERRTRDDHAMLLDKSLALGSSRRVNALGV